MVSISHLVYDAQIPEEYGIRPVWERLFGYFSAAGIMAAGLIFYTFLFHDDFHCIPLYPRNMTAKFSLPQSHYVDKYCSVKFERSYMFGTISALGVLVMLMIPLLSNIWLTIPSVINTFRTFVKARDEIERFTLGVDDVTEALSSQQFFSSREKILLERIQWTLWRFNGVTTIWKWYIFRCTVLLLYLAGALSVFGSVYTGVFVEAHYRCNGGLLIEPFKMFLCTYGTAEKMKTIFIVCFGILVVQVCFIGASSVFMIKSMFLNDQRFFTDDFQSLRVLIQFMRTLWIYSGPLRCSGFDEFLSQLISVEYLDSRLDGCIATLNTTELEYVKFYSSIREGGGNHIIRAVCHDYLKKEANLASEGNHTKFCMALKHADLTTWDETSIKFAKDLASKNYWQLLVSLLECSAVEARESLVMQQCGVFDFDLLSCGKGSGGSDTGKSILVFALEGNLRSYTALRHILSCTTTQAKIVEDGVDKLAKEYVAENVSRYSNAQLMLIQRLLDDHERSLRGRRMSHTQLVTSNEDLEQHTNEEDVDLLQV